MDQKIKCGVEECHFNNSLLCQADAIEVRSSGTRKVNNSDSTACETFRPREF